MILEKILGVLKGKEGFARSDRNFTKIENEVNSLETQINDLEAKQWMPDNWKAEADLPSTYLNNSITYFRITSAWNSGKIAAASVIKTIKYNDTITKQESFRNDGVPLYYRLMNTGTLLWGAWQEIVTTNQPDWITATLQNGWTGTLQYRKNQIGLVEVSGSINAGTITAGTIIATLPLGYTPQQNKVISAQDGQFGVSRTSCCVIATDGKLTVYNPGASTLQATSILRIVELFKAS